MYKHTICISVPKGTTQNEINSIRDKYKDRYEDFKYIHDEVFNRDNNFGFESNKPFKTLIEYFNSIYGDRYKLNEDDNTISKKVIKEKTGLVEETGYKDEDYIPHSWDEEQQYFSNLKEYDPFLFDKITEKIK